MITLRLLRDRPSRLFPGTRSPMPALGERSAKSPDATLRPRRLRRGRERRRRRSGRDCSECLLYLSHVRAFYGSFVKGEVLVDSDQPKALTSRRLDIEVRVRYLELPHETGLEDFSAHLFHVVGLDFQPDRSRSSQKLALIVDIAIEKRDEEVLSQANEVSLGIRLRDLAAEDITIELTNAVPVLPRN